MEKKLMSNNVVQKYDIPIMKSSTCPVFDLRLPVSTLTTIWQKSKIHHYVSNRLLITKTYFRKKPMDTVRLGAQDMLLTVVFLVTAMSLMY